MDESGEQRMHIYVYVSECGECGLSQTQHREKPFASLQQAFQLALTSGRGAISSYGGGLCILCRGSMHPVQGSYVSNDLSQMIKALLAHR